jgi:sugar phosphate isomerase/epimerase
MLKSLLAAAEGSKIKVGVCDWSIGMRGKLEAMELAKQIGLDGLEISPSGAADKLSYTDPEVQKKYAELSKKTGIEIASLAITVMNSCPLASDPRGPAWLEQTVKATADMGAKNILLAFFGKGDLRSKAKTKKKAPGERPLNPEAVKVVVERLKAVAPMAKEKGVALGLENTLSAKQNMEIMEKVGCDSVKVYYDIANSTRNGYDVPAEIRMLKDKINQFHFKDNKGEFNSGNPEMGPIVEAVKEIKYGGWIILERCFGKDKVAYFGKNAAFVRKAFGLKKPA